MPDAHRTLSLLPVQGTRRVTKGHMLYNQSNPVIAIHPSTGVVHIDGAPLSSMPSGPLPLNCRYLLI